ncbi:MAG: ATP/GTP-binding protein [Nitrososphaerota archaeon]|nr:ATP/GTP-binding protein [Aigarchaeota archaeon]MDW8076835.1 ATP/GTP-binding protein [Nitrososphaerota archaeon]
MLNVVFIGTAGCGKTSLTHVFGKWLENELDADVSYVNLDPGVHITPYSPSYDVREIITVERLMDYGLGPNGAMIRAAEIIEEKISEVSRKVRALESDFKLIDTPGQMELFLFRPMGPRFIEEMSKHTPTVSVYIIDPALVSNLSGLAISFLLPVMTRLRLGVPVVSVINKADLLEVYKVEEFSKNLRALEEKMFSEERGLIVDLASRFLELIEEFSKNIRIVKTSAKTGEGMNDLYTLIHEALCECGDLM